MSKVVSGGGNYIEAESSSGRIEQIIIAALKMSPNCKMNPTSGFVTIKELQSANDEIDIGYTLLNPNNSCDGTMKITAATGNYIKSNGKSVQLDSCK